MSNPTYYPPVDKLLSYGECNSHNVQPWSDYRQDLDLNAEHIPALIEMVQDEALWDLLFTDADAERTVVEQKGWDPDVAFWAPIHAWRALGQLQAAEAVKPLAYVLEHQDIDWCWEELPEVFGLIGPEAIPPLDELISPETADLDYNSKVILVSGLTKIAQNFSDERDRCVEVCTRHLSNYENQHITLNGSLALALYKLKALEAVPVMEAAYTAGKVDEMMMGSWARVQVNLGLKEESDFTAEELAIHHTPEQEELLANIRAYLNRHKSSAAEKGLPVQREAFLPKPLLSFKDVVAQTGMTQPSQVSGFGQSSKPTSKKDKKKKKKKK